MKLSQALRLIKALNGRGSILRELPEEVKLACFDQVVWQAGFIDLTGTDPTSLTISEVRARWVEFNESKESRSRLYERINLPRFRLVK